MIIYICEKCNKNFGNRKSNYFYHINKINSCENNINMTQNATKTVKLIQQNTTKVDNLEKIKYCKNNEVNIINEINIEDIDVKNKIKLEIPKINKQETKSKYICEHCNYCFTRNSSLKNHLLNRCKIKKQKDNNEKNQINELIELNKQLIKQNEEIKKELDEIKNNNINSKPNIITQNTSNNVNSNNNVNIHINNFSTMDYSKINKNQLLNTILQNTGKQIYLKAIENMFVNPEKPENHNLYIADKNRQYVKKYNDGRWNTDNFNIIDLLINNFIDYYKLSPLKILNENLIF
jgi:hypothetical protein